MLNKLEMHDIQDKQRLLDEMNETREAVNAVDRNLGSLNEKVEELAKKLVVAVQHFKEFVDGASMRPSGKKGK